MGSSSSLPASPVPHLPLQSCSSQSLAGPGHSGLDAVIACVAGEEVLGILWQVHSNTTPLTATTVGKTSGGAQLQRQLQLCAVGSLGQHCHLVCRDDGKVVEAPYQRRGMAVDTPQYTG